MKKRIAVLIIDAQNDFCSPKGSLFVDGSVEDNERLSKWIVDNKEEINYIGCTLDSHQLIDIAHQRFWVDKDGNNPAPFTVISASDVESGKWSAVKPQTALKYLRDLEADGQFPHVIWPEHCIIGTWGNQLDPKVNDAILSWAANGHHVHYVSKGAHPDTEHFGAFEAQVPIENNPLTQYNLPLQKTLEKYDVIYLAGQAKNFCVVNTLNQMISKSPDLAKKIVVLEDCMSNVQGFEEAGKDVWENAKKLGTKISTTDKETLTNSNQHSVV